MTDPMRVQGLCQQLSDYKDEAEIPFAAFRDKHGRTPGKYIRFAYEDFMLRQKIWVRFVIPILEKQMLV